MIAVGWVGPYMLCPPSGHGRVGPGQVYAHRPVAGVGGQVAHQHRDLPAAQAHGHRGVALEDDPLAAGVGAVVVGAGVVGAVASAREIR